MLNHEIEFKTLLTKEEFHQLKDRFQPFEKIWQKNFYFDTPDFQLKAHHCGLRIRLFADGKAEATLKTPAEVGLIETTELLSKKQLQTDWKKQFPTFESIDKKLEFFNIVPSTLVLFAELETTRFEKDLKNNIAMMIDHSQYYGTEDFELEVEVPNLKIGKPFYEHFLAENHLSYRPAVNKIARALNQKERSF